MSSERAPYIVELRLVQESCSQTSEVAVFRGENMPVANGATEIALVSGDRFTSQSRHVGAE